MKLCLKNQYGDKIILDVLPTHTIKQVISMVYAKNILLKDYITSNVYEHTVELSLNGMKLNIERTLADYGIDVLLRLVSEQGVNAASDLEMSMIDGVYIPGLNKANLIDLKLEKPKIPEELRCPLSTQIFRNPIVLPCGTLAEKAFVLKWVREKGSCPFTRQPLSEQIIYGLIPDLEKQKQVAEFLLQHKERVYYKELEQQQYPEEELTLSTPSRRQGPTEPDIDDREAINLVLASINPTPSQQLHRRMAANAPDPMANPIDIYAALLDVLPAELFAQTIRQRNNRNARNSTIFFRNPHISPINHSGNEYIRRQIQETVSALQEYGITEELIIQHWQINHSTASWDGFAKETLIFLIKGTPPQTVLRQPINPLPEHLRLQPISALQEMTRLTDDGMQALSALYEKGLRGDHLRALPGNFRHGHRAALIHLVNDMGFSVSDSLQQIRGISEEQAWDIYTNRAAASAIM